MKKLILSIVSVLTLAGGYVFFSGPCCSTSDTCEASTCCPDKPDCCQKANVTAAASSVNSL